MRPLNSEKEWYLRDANLAHVTDDMLRQIKSEGENYHI